MAKRQARKRGWFAFKLELHVKNFSGPFKTECGAKEWAFNRWGDLGCTTLNPLIFKDTRIEKPLARFFEKAVLLCAQENHSGVTTYNGRDFETLSQAREFFRPSDEPSNGLLLYKGHTFSATVSGFDAADKLRKAR